VTFGWQENVWSINSANWVHKDRTDAEIMEEIVDPTIYKWKRCRTYDEPYRPHFFVIDKYEQDSTISYHLGYMWNARDMENFIKYGKFLGEQLDNTPVMLW
jgi:hypothetical protein